MKQCYIPCYTSETRLLPPFPALLRWSLPPFPALFRWSQPPCLQRQLLVSASCPIVLVSALIYTRPLPSAVVTVRLSQSIDTEIQASLARFSVLRLYPLYCHRPSVYVSTLPCTHDGIGLSSTEDSRSTHDIWRMLAIQSVSPPQAYRTAHHQRLSLFCSSHSSFIALIIS